MSRRFGFSVALTFAHAALFRVVTGCEVALIISLGATGVIAQAPPSGEAPRFFLKGAPRDPPTAIDADSVPALRRRITLELSDVSLEDALRALARLSSLSLVYSADVVPLDRHVSLPSTDISVSAALVALLSGTDTDVLLSADGHAALVRRGASRQSRPFWRLGGRVVDAATGRGLAGATVNVEGTMLRVTADDRGMYRLDSVPAGPHTITARHLGYASQSRPVPAEQATGAEPDSASGALDRTLGLALVAHPNMLDRVIVAGSIIPSTMSQSPVPVAVLDADQVTAPSRLRIDQLLRGGVAGVVSYDNGAFALGAPIFVRGSASLDNENLLKVYVDGVEAPTSTLISAIDLTDIDHAELLRGPQASTLYGSDASGGVLLLFSRRGRRGPPRISGSVSGGVTASDYVSRAPHVVEHRLAISGASERLDYSLAAAYDAAGQVVPRGDRRQAALHGRIAYTLGPITVALTGAANHQVIGASTVPALRDSGSAADNPPADALDAHYRLDDRFAGLTVTYAPSGRWQHHLTIGEHGVGFPSAAEEQRFVEGTPSDASRQGDAVASGRYFTSFAWTPMRHLSSSTTAGTEYARRTRSHRRAAALDPFAPSGLPLDTATRNGGVFVQHVLGVDERLFLTTGARAEWNSDIGSTSRAVWSPRIGVVYALHAGSEVVLRPRVAYGRSIRVPRPGQAAESIVQRANPELRPETQRGAEAGLDVDYGHGVLDVEVTYFGQRATDLIGETRLGDPFDPSRGDTTLMPFLQHRNVGRVRNRGVELAASMAAGPLVARGAFSMVRSAVEQLGEGYIGDQRVGDDMLYVARRSGGAAADLRVRPLVPNPEGRPTHISAELTYVGPRRSLDLLAMHRCETGQGPCADAEAGYRVVLPPFTKLRIGASHPIGGTLDAFVDVDNVTNDQRGELFGVVPSRGRTLLFGARFGR